MVGPIIEDPIDKYYFLQIFGDEMRYGQIIINFLTNAVKFSKVGGTVSVHLNVTNIEEVESSEHSLNFD